MIPLLLFECIGISSISRASCTVESGLGTWKCLGWPWCHRFSPTRTIHMDGFRARSGLMPMYWFCTKIWMLWLRTRTTISITHGEWKMSMQRFPLVYWPTIPILWRVDMIRVLLSSRDSVDLIFAVTSEEAFCRSHKIHIFNLLANNSEVLAGFQSQIANFAYTVQVLLNWLHSETVSLTDLVFILLGNLRRLCPDKSGGGTIYSQA